MKNTLLSICLVCLASTVIGQSVIRNPSFEGRSGMNKLPLEWDICKRGSTPDILPGYWEVTTPPADGDNYVGLITRSEGTWESIGQQLSTPVVPEECHTFSLKLARSATYVNFNLPIRLRIYLGNGICDRGQLVGESSNINATDWKEYIFSFIPDRAYTHLVLEAYYGNGIYFYYNGNILIDDLSEIKLCPRA